MDFVDTALKRRIPNAITLLRILIAVAFFAVLGGYRFPDQGILFGNIAIALFVLAATTDFIDGYLARKWNVVSMFGISLDGRRHHCQRITCHVDSRCHGIKRNERRREMGRQI